MAITAWVRKASDENRQSTTTLTADSALTVSLSANTKYLVEVWFEFTSGATPDFKWDFNYSGTLANETAGWMEFFQPQVPDYSGGTIANVTVVRSSNLNSTNYNTAVSGLANTRGMVRLPMPLDVSTAGTFAVRWAQNTSAATNTTVFAGGYIIADTL